MKKNFLLSIFLCATTALAADVPLVATVQQRYQQLQSITARFTCTTTIPSVRKTLKNTGGIALAKGGKLRIEYATQPPLQYVSDGATLWVYTDGDPQYTAMKLGSAGLPKDALTFLTGFADLKKLYSIALDESDASGQTLILTPKQRSEYQRVIARFRDDGVVDTLRIEQGGGSHTEYQFSAIALDTALPAGVFTFTPPDDVTAVR